MNHYPVYNDLCRRRWASGQFWSFVTHAGPHLDEIFAMWLVIFFGKRANRFKVDQANPFANIEFWNQGGNTPDGKPWKAHAMQGKILLGCAPGSEFDEHEQIDVQARKGYSCASTMHEFLELNDPAVKPLLDAVVDNDLNGGKFTLGLARLTQMLMHAGNDPVQTIRWAILALYALYNKARPHVKVGNNNLIFPGKRLDRTSELAALWLILDRQPDVFGGDPVSMLIALKSAGKLRDGTVWVDQPLAKYVADFKEGCPYDWAMRKLGLAKYQPARSLRSDLRTMLAGDVTASSATLSMASIITAMEVNGQGWPLIVDWSFTAFHARYQAARQYIYACKDVDVAIKGGALSTIEWQGKLVKILTIDSDNRQIIGGAWKQGADVLLVRKKSGHTSLFFSKAGFEHHREDIRVLMDNAAANLRSEELSILGVKLTDAAPLRATGSLPILRQWCYRPDICMIANGGDSADGVTPTKLTLSHILSIVRALFAAPILRVVSE